jgi:GT2 family glycosyltransferase
VRKPSSEKALKLEQIFPEDVTVAIVSYNSGKRLAGVLVALVKAGCPLDRIMVIDNASTDGCEGWDAGEFPGIRLVYLPENRGPNPARNVGLVEARTPYVFLMDDDVHVEPDTIPLLRQMIAADPAIAITCPMVLNDDPPGTILYAKTDYHFMCEAINLVQGLPVEQYPREPQEIGIAPGGALLVSRAAALRVGLFDENYFIGKADTDFSQVIRIAGYKIVLVPSSRVVHLSRQRGDHRFYYHIRNRWYFMLKNYQLRTLLLLSPALLLHEWLEITFLLFKGHGVTYLKAVVELLRLFPQAMQQRFRVARLRVRPDRELMASGPILIRQDLLGNPLIRRIKGLYDAGLQAYWSLVCRLG